MSQMSQFCSACGKSIHGRAVICPGCGVPTGVSSGAHPMAILGLIVNIFIPGIGSIIVGRVSAGIAQLILDFFAFLFSVTGIGMIIGAPLGLIVWIWALVISIRAFSNSARTGWV